MAIIPMHIHTHTLTVITLVVILTEGACHDKTRAFPRLPMFRASRMYHLIRVTTPALVVVI